jgi:glycosyltransferase involved in cell wall biosynthesis
MRILLLTNKVPFPATGGYAIVVYNTIKEFVSSGCEVTLFSLNTSRNFVKTKEINDSLFKQIKFVQYKINADVSIKGAFLNLFSKESYNLSRFFEVDCANKLAYLLRTKEFDIIQLEGLFVVPYLDIIRASSTAKVIYRAHNIEHQIWKRLTTQESSLFRKLYYNFLSNRLQTYEKSILNKFDTLFAISSVDEHFFKSIGCNIPVYTFPVSLNRKEYAKEFPLCTHKSIGYIGSMDWRPNMEGLQWFLEKVWPLIQQLDSGITFHLAGKYLPKHLTSYSDHSFVIEGEVEDALEFIARQHVFVVPLLSGSGMRVKIIEAMALGKCVIATSIAAEGIHYQHDKNILIADKADDFYKQILRCFTDKNLVSRIGQQAKKLVDKYHDNEKSSRAMLKLYRELCGHKD